MSLRGRVGVLIAGRRLFAYGCVCIAALSLVACVETPKAPVGPVSIPTQPAPHSQPQPLPTSPPSEPARPVQSLSTLPGWEATDPFIALEAVRGACAYRQGRQYARVCDALKAQSFEQPDEIKHWLEARFRVERIEGEGLLTAYFVPEYPATTVPSAEFSQPVRTKPADLVLVDGAQMTPPQPAGKRFAARRVGELYVPYYTRAEIEAQTVTGPAYYMRPEDYFFMQIQGSGYLTLEDGTRFMAAYAADNGLPFVGIAKTLTERGLLKREQTSGEVIRQWLADNRGPVAQEVMNQNPRYAFFSIDMTKMEPLGAAAIPLPAGAAIAVDPSFHSYGDLYWVDADTGSLTGAFPAYRRMVAALDTGGAIRGQIRADLYMGHGDRAGREAGRVKHRLRLWRIVPAE
nr:MltA domain-containing protein [Asticcacaulis currens]